MHDITGQRLTDTEKFLFSQTEKRIIKKDWNLSILKSSCFFKLDIFLNKSCLLWCCQISYCAEIADMAFYVLEKIVLLLSSSNSGHLPGVHYI